MKRSRLSYDEWKCIISKDIHGKTINSEYFNGYIGLIDIKEVSQAQIWKFNGEDIVVCDKGYKWLSILPQNDWYCITAMMDEKGNILLWYIDMIAKQGIDVDGVPYFDDLYLDLVVYPDGTIIVDDMDELEEALSKKDITQEQFHLAIATSHRLQQGILSDISSFIGYTRKCYEIVKVTIDFVVADEDAAEKIAKLRHTIWCTTYRGIYSDERIDNFDYEGHRQRDLQRIQDPVYHVYLIVDGDTPIGYFAFMDTGMVYIQSLYILQEYQHQGIGKRVFSLIRQYCRAHGYSKFSCNCNAHNAPAQVFYRAMGGTIIKRDEGHKDKYDDQVTFEFQM